MSISKNQKRKLVQLADKKHREREKLFVAEGEKIAKELLRHHNEGRLLIQQIFAHPDWFLRNKSILPKKGIELIESEPELLRKASSLSTPPGVILTVRMPEQAEPNELPEKDIVMAFEAIRDPGNLGTIIRTADWFGVRQIYCSPDSVDRYNPKCIQSSMGAIARVEVIYTELADLLQKASKKGIPVYGTRLDGEDMYAMEKTANGIIVFGNESRGLSPEIRKLLSRNIRIPEYPRGELSTESLNIASSAAIILAEWRRGS